MQCFRLVLVGMAVLTTVHLLPTGPTTVRSGQVSDSNATSPDIITLDTRTPPKFKQHAKKKNRVPLGSTERSHVGVAIPVDDDQLLMEETTKKLNFYKIEKPTTTNSGLSTWILLNTQASTTKPTRKPNEDQNATVLIEQNKIIKPIFKKRGTSTTTPGTTLSTSTATEATNLVRVKAALVSTSSQKPATTAAVVTTTTESSGTTVIDVSTLPVEAKDGENELTSDVVKKAKRPSTKRKKNKNKRRRPSDKSDVAASKIEKPIGTQLYNYLSREIMPTVGMGLVGLVVTAGLAGYFLYPFGAARRSYDIDRRDKDYYQYPDEYSGGIAEEEAIGKVIAGMPSNALYGNSLKTPASRQQQPIYQDDEVTPVAVPEHGPRRFRKRRRRQIIQLVQNDLDNEIDSVLSTSSTTTTTPKPPPPQYKPSLLTMLKDLVNLKIDMGLKFLQRASLAVNKYVTEVQQRLEYHRNNTT